MRRIVLVTIFLLLMATSVSAECVVNQNTVMYFDIDRFIKVAKYTVSSEQQGLAMIMDDIQRGNAVGFPKGTKVESVVKNSNNPSIATVKIKGMSLFGLSDVVSCTGKNVM